MSESTTCWETLDPTTEEEWASLRRLGHRMVDEVVDLHRGIRDRAAWRPVPDDVRRRLKEPLPREGSSADEAFETFQRDILPYYLGNIHPRGWGWVNGTGTTLGAFADMLAAAMNPNCAGADHSARYVEGQVLDTLKEALDWPKEGTGLLTSGGSVANLVGLAAARNSVKAPVELRTRGLRALPRQLVLYASETVHNSIDKAAGLLGIGAAQIRKIPVDEDWRMIPEALAAAVAADRKQGTQPFCVVATAGTVDQGAVDPLEELADLCGEEDLWLHVDAAFGAVAALSEELHPLVAGMERADSLAFDLHKWMHVPIEAGCILVRDGDAHRLPFAAPASYLATLDRGITAGEAWLSDLGPQLTRGFRALKCWFALRVHGIEKLGRLAAQNVQQTRALESLIRKHPNLEVLAHGPLVVLCLRYRPDEGAWNAESLDILNAEILADIQESGIVAVSTTRINGSFALRLALTNQRTRREDLGLFLDTVLEFGARRTASRCYRETP